MNTSTFSGSCLCGAIRYTASGEAQRFYHCHCSRCRKASGTGHSSNLFVMGELTWHSGQGLLSTFRPPEARRFTNTFCKVCGSRMPRFIEKAGMVFIPAGSLDGDPGLQPQARIFLDSKASWSCDGGAMQCFDQYPA